MNEPTARRRLSADARREEILAAARRLFAENGYAATTTRQLADAAGASDALLYRHFGSKREVLDGVIDRALEVFSTLPPLERMRELPVEGLLHALGEGFLGRIQKNLDLIALLVGNNLGQDDIRFATFIDHAARGLGGELARRVPTLDPTDGYLTARSFFGSLISFVILQRLLGMDDVNPVSSERYLDHLVTATASTLVTPRRA